MNTPQKRLERIHGAPSWRFSTDRVKAWLTRDGGHLGPVEFRLGRRIVQPYSVAPWLPGDVRPELPAVLRSLRGDFFCCPFGRNDEPWRREKHTLNGETASGRWSLLGLTCHDGGVRLTAEMRTTTRLGRVIKTIELRNGETNVYCRHELRGYSGPMCLGHHTMLRFPEADGAGLVATSPFRHGQVSPLPFQQPSQGGYQSLVPGARFRRLDRVPLATGGYADLSRYPARAGYEDLVMVSAPTGPLAWTTVSFPREGYLWFGLKDPTVLPSTILWCSNGGRHYAPWSGRHRRVLGLEEVAAYFAFGLAASARPNPLNRQGVPTTVSLSRNRPLRVNYIMGIVEIPSTFGHVSKVRCHAGGVTFVDRRGRKATAAVDWTFLSHARPLIGSGLSHPQVRSG
jgi:hypothetical protein